MNTLNTSTIKHAFAGKNTLEAKQKIPDTDQHGWDVIDGTYKVNWRTIKLPLRIF